jgi:Protein of unknown function (DUF3105)/TIR domain
MLGQIYVGYSQRDRAYAEALAQHLGARGVVVWYDQRGEIFDPFVQQAIDEASVVIVVQTPTSAESPAVTQQLQYAASRGKQLVALLLEPSTTPPALAAAHVVDVRGGRLPGDDLALWLHQLVQWHTARLTAGGGAVGAGPAGSGRRQALGWILGGAAAVLLIVVVVAVAVALLPGRNPANPPRSWQERAAAIDGIIVYIDPASPDYDETVRDGTHYQGVLTYPMSPPAGGPHNPIWQNCMGDVYPAEIAKEHAVHALEHGAVWLTYRPDLPPDQVETLAAKVNGVEFTLMSPYPNLDAPISLQAWGYQLKVDNAADERIDDFITALRRNATQETMAGCSGGVTDPSPVPFDS